MLKSTNVKNKINKTKNIKIAETLAAVYIYIYIYGGCHLVNKINAKYAENINKDRTMLKKYNMGLSLCLFGNRDGPKLQN